MAYFYTRKATKQANVFGETISRGLFNEAVPSGTPEKLAKRSTDGAMDGLVSKVLSFTPGFSPVPQRHDSRNRLNGFQRCAKETVETVLNVVECFSTGLKPGVNERTFKAKASMDRYTDKPISLQDVVKQRRISSTCGSQNAENNLPERGKGVRVSAAHGLKALLSL